jgi:sulfate adenylyltransferase subunit 1
MTSACGVVSKILDQKSNDQNTFSYKEFKARGDLFEEYYYNTETLSLSKFKPSTISYTVGDEIPIKGDSYDYPEDLDVLVLRDWTFIKIRNKKITEMNSIDSYQYSGKQIANGRGFRVNVHSAEELEAFFEEYRKIGDDREAEFMNKWVTFEAFRRVIFSGNYWVI